jgi:hypothetical protein
MADEAKNEKRISNHAAQLATQLELLQAMAKTLESHRSILDVLIANDAAEHAKVTEMAEEIQRLKTWTGLPEKNDLRGPAPGTLYTTVGVLRDLLLRVWAHLGLPEGDVLPKTKGGVN